MYFQVLILGADKDEMKLEVNQDDFLNAAQNVKPSISKSDLENYSKITNK